METVFSTALATTVIDTAIVTELIALVKSVMGLFSEFPMNILLTASLVKIGFSIFNKATSSARF